MNVKEFLQQTLPANGTSYFAALLGHGNFTQHKLGSITDLVAYADKCATKKCDVYFATGSFDTKRTADDCQYKRALYLDIDCGPGKPYDSKRAGITELIKFCDENFVRPNIIVDSGNGIHTYWTFKTEVSTEAWLPLATALKELCELHGFGADPTVTADAARILRIPGTYNQKGEEPLQVKILHASTKEFNYQDIKELLKQKKSNAMEQLGALTQEQDLEFIGGIDSKPFFAAKIIDRCNVLKHTYTTGGSGQPEPLWMAQLSLMSYAVDGNEYIHALSEGHDNYDYRRTEKKYAQRVVVKEAGKYGPPLCKTLGMYLPEKCSACRFSGRIRSPIVLGREDDGNEIPYPYKQDDKAIYKLTQVKVADGETEEKLVKIISYPIENFQVFDSPDLVSGRVYRFDMINKDHSATVEFTKQQLVDRRQLLVQLSVCGVELLPEEYQEFHRLMASWAKKMKAARQVGKPTTALGWTKYNEEPAFTLINKTITKSSGDKEVTFLDKEFVKDFTPQGERDVWIKLGKYLTAENRHPITAGILSAFAAPLIPFTGVNGCVFAIVSDKSGTGKSTSLRAAQSIWGDPRKGVNALDDTPLSVANRMGKLNNLPAFWDELRMQQQVEKFVILMFQVSQGKERSRLTSSIQTRHVGTWNTLITVASNESITDHVRHLVHGTDAGLLRVFEVTVPYLKRQKDIDSDIAALDKNFGHIGPEYAEWLVKNYDHVLKTIDKVKSKFTKRVNAESSERFWTATCVSLLTGGIISNKLGYTSIKLDEFYDWLVKEFIRSREEQTMDYDPVDIRAKKFLLQFLDISKDQLVVFDHLSGKGVTTMGKCHSPIPSGEVLGVFAKEDKKVRIKKAPFINWIYEFHKEPHTRLIEALKEHGCIERRASVSVGIPNAVATRTAVLDIPLDSNTFSDLLEDI